MGALYRSPEHGQGQEVLVFGPQFLSFNADSAEALRVQLHVHQSFAWVRNALQDLSSYWDTAASALPSLCASDGKRLLGNLATWLQTGNIEVLHFPLHNTMLTPLVVASHLTQYQKLIVNSDVCDSVHSLPRVLETLGLCTGHLSAAAVSCAEDMAQLELYGAIAIRLAMLIGALVDSKDASLTGDGRASSFSVAWNTCNDGLVEEILKGFPDVNIFPVFVTC